MNNLNIKNNNMDSNKSNTNNRLDQGQFMYVKQRLDYYRIPSASFPLEAITILSKLLKLLDQNNNNRLYQKQNIRY